MRKMFFIAILLVSLSLCFDAKGEGGAASGVRVVVIDAGHGGPRFPGARYGGYNEKDINLQVALKLGALIESGMPGVKVVYTRKVEKQFSSVLTDDLQARADIANNAEGDLFISIHSNASRNTDVRGVETLIMGESSMETRINEAAVYLNNKEELLDMSDDKTAAIVRAYIQNLQFTYGQYSEMMARLVQKHYVKLGLHNRGVRKQPLKVLYATDMPSVLTEIGFMSNAAELKYITSEKGQNEIAKAIFGAVKDYSDFVRKTLLPDAPKTESQTVAQPKTEAKPQPKAEAKPQPKPEVQPAQSSPTPKQTNAVRYTIQIMANDKPVPLNHSEFGAYRGSVKEVLADGRFKYKYCVGDYADKASAQADIAAVRKHFALAFVIAVSNGKVVDKK
ncbi:MAG: N-acetylmuramoyl-L-alanine amidase [Alistipes sp.]|nr:N-acetylmuramoyl-L-alanine amidase [Alistipes sp.]